MNIDGLRVNCVEEKPVEIDWLDTPFTSWETERCERCDTVVAGYLEVECPECESQVWVGGGPLMDFLYPLPEDVGDPEATAKVLMGLPLALVYLENAARWGLALTVGGMNCSWEIVEAYVRLGYLPPFHFVHLPEMAGMKWDAVSELIVTACRKSCQVVAGQAQNGLTRLDRIERRLKG